MQPERVSDTGRAKAGTKAQGSRRTQLQLRARALHIRQRRAVAERRTAVGRRAVRARARSLPCGGLVALLLLEVGLLGAARPRVSHPEQQGKKMPTSQQAFCKVSKLVTPQQQSMYLSCGSQAQHSHSRAASPRGPAGACFAPAARQCCACSALGAHRHGEDVAVAQVVPQRRAARVDLLQLVQQQALDAVQHGLHERGILAHRLHVPVPAHSPPARLAPPLGLMRVILVRESS